MSEAVVTVVVDCHAYPWHVADPEYPECGPDNLVRMAEQYGALIEVVGDDDPDNPAPGWAWWYRLTGPPEHLVRLLADEYTGNDEEYAREIVEASR